MPAAHDLMSLVEPLTRMATTAVVVIAVAMAVGRFGPLIGGALAGFPIVLGPGFYFLAAKASPGFVAEAASYTILSLCATQMFLLAYIATASRATPLISIAAASVTWLASVVLLRLLPPQPLLGAAVFLGLTCIARGIGGRYRRPAARVKRAESIRLLLLRGALAGLLVAVITTASGRFGSDWSGLLLGYPIGYTVIAVTLHEQSGRDVTIATLYAALVGTVSLATFSFVLALLSPVMAPYGAFACALAASVSFTIGLLIYGRLRKPARASLCDGRVGRYDRRPESPQRGA